MTGHKPYTFGMELEINLRRREKEGWKVMPWMRPSHWESNRIYEYQTMPCDGREFLRRSCLLGHMLGFEHARGEYDERAESFHLHMGARRIRPSYFNQGHVTKVEAANALNATPMLLAAHHLSRTGVRFRSRQDTFLTGQEHTHLENRCLVNGMMANNGNGTMELRLNENPAPLVATMLYPTVLDERFQASVKGMKERYHGEGSPSAIAADVRRIMGDKMMHGMMSAAKQYWKFDLVNEVLDMFVEGADSVAVWEHADLYFKKGKLYPLMLKEAGI